MKHIKQETKDLMDGYKLKDYVVEEFGEKYRLTIIFTENNDIFDVQMRWIGLARNVVKLSLITI